MAREPAAVLAEIKRYLAEMDRISTSSKRSLADFGGNGNKEQVRYELINGLSRQIPSWLDEIDSFRPMTEHDRHRQRRALEMIGSVVPKADVNASAVAQRIEQIRGKLDGMKVRYAPQRVVTTAANTPIEQPWKARQFHLERYPINVIKEERLPYRENKKIVRENINRQPFFRMVADFKDRSDSRSYIKNYRKGDKIVSLSPHTHVRIETRVVKGSLPGEKEVREIKHRSHTYQQTFDGEVFKTDVYEKRAPRVRKRTSVDIDLTTVVGDLALIAESKKLPDKPSPETVADYVAETMLLHRMLLVEPEILRRLGPEWKRVRGIVPVMVTDRPLTESEQRKVQSYKRIVNEEFAKAMAEYEGQRFEHFKSLIKSLPEARKRAALERYQKEQRSRLSVYEEAMGMDIMCVTKKEAEQVLEDMVARKELERSFGKKIDGGRLKGNTYLLQPKRKLATAIAVREHYPLARRRRI